MFCPSTGPSTPWTCWASGGAADLTSPPMLERQSSSLWSPSSSGGKKWAWNPWSFWVTTWEDTWLHRTPSNTQEGMSDFTAHAWQQRNLPAVSSKPPSSCSCLSLHHLLPSLRFQLPPFWPRRTQIKCPQSFMANVLSSFCDQMSSLFPRFECVWLSWGFV